MGVATLSASESPSDSYLKFKKFVFIITLFISGFCGISYEILYSRALANVIGDSFVLNASILIMFLLGIGIGTKIAHRLNGFLWLIESGIGIYALFFIFLYPSLDYFFYQLLPAGNIYLTILSCAALLSIPTILIGCSLPLFAHLFQEFIPGKIFDLSYMVYNFGASLTAFAIEFYLIRNFGINKTIFVILSLNFLSGALLFAFFRTVQKKEAQISEKEVYPLNIILSLCALSIASAIFQLLAIKIAEFVFGPFHETFAMVVSLVLLGIALGSLINRYFKPSFLFFTLSSTLFIAIIIGLFQPLLFGYATLYNNFSEQNLIVLKMLTLACFMLWLSICFGAAIPALLRSESDVAEESGHLLFVSSMANAFGYLLMVLFIHSTFNYGQTLLIILILLAVSSIIYSWPKRQAILATIAVFGLGLSTYSFAWNENLLYVNYKSFNSDDLLRQKIGEYKWGSQYRKYEDVFSINKIGDEEFFFINGYVSMALNSIAEYLVGVLSSMPAPRLKESLVLGLGSGSTASTVTQIFEHTDVIEINPIIVEHQEDMKEHNFNIAQDPRASLIVDDGIRYLKNTPKKYDLILNTVTSPLYFSSSKLYTVDFFNTVKNRLQPDGIYTTWIDRRIGEEGFKIILKSLKSEFKYAWAAMIRHSYFLLVCSNEPIQLNQMNQVEQNKALTAFFRHKRSRSLDSIKYAFVSTDAFGFLEQVKDIGKTPLNTLDRPTLEFAMSNVAAEANIEPFKNYVKKNYGRTTKILPKNPLKLAQFYVESQQNNSFVRYFLQQAYSAEPGIKQKLPQLILKESKESWEKAPSVQTGKEYAQWLAYYGKDQASMAVINQLMTDFPNDAYSYYKFAKSYIDQGDFYKGHYFLKKAIEKSPDNNNYKYMLAELYFAENKFSQAENQLWDILEKSPTYDAAWYRLGRLYHFQESYEKSEKAFKKALSYQKNNDLYTFWLGRALFEQKKYRESEKMFRQSLKQAPEDEITLKWLKKSIISESL